MAIRTRKFNVAKQQANTNLELIWWVFMRLSGLLLAFLVLAHIYANNIRISNTEINYTYVATRFSQPIVKLLDILILYLALLHGTNGLRYVIEDYIKSDSWRDFIKYVLYILVAILMIAGTMLVFSFPFNKVGG